MSSIVLRKRVESNMRARARVCCSEEIASKYEGKLQRKMNGPEYEVVTRIMKTLTSKKLIVPNASLWGRALFLVLGKLGEIKEVRNLENWIKWEIWEKWEILENF